ncbi:LysE family translocator [Pseudomonas sp.]|uniref:LysE family translocator n=1 Tax=Pseudomonas sp. TaxID=306 RepID=UPI002C6BDFD8|nr:LysE family translocator [Pseudomonas sp.]HUE93047.1 LysE family translocator [Pseudomonas sp.]
MALHTWLLYLTAVIGLALTPGPNGLLALSHGALYGHRRTLFTVGGGVLGFTLLMALSMLGIGTLLQASAQALTILKWLGGAYLIWLGIQLWRAPPLHLAMAEKTTERSGFKLFRQGLLSALSNPKVILFFGAFLPQFLDPRGDLWLQFAIMAATFAVVEGCVEYLLARMAHRVRPWLQRSGKGFNRCCGSLFALMGAALPMTR